MGNVIINLVDFLKNGIWRIRARRLSKTRSLLLRQLRIFILAFRGFNEDKCQLRASALTFYSLLSIVPIAAMAFGIAKGFGFEKRLELVLLEKFQGQEEVIGRVIEFAQSFLENTQGGVIAGIGVGVLFWTVIKVLGNIEKSFNDIWGVKRSRTMGRKLSDYLSIMLLCPILLIMSSSMTVMITSQVTLILEKITILGIFAPLIMMGLKVLPYIFLWVLFTFIYTFMPNTKVLFRSGLLGGIIAGTIYQLAQWGYITFQVGASKYGAIYGSFAALPLFLIWLQISWLIVLFGAEISFAEQNVETYEFEPDCHKASNAFKGLLAVRITQLCVYNFAKAKVPWTANQISHRVEIPIRLVRQILFDLTESGVLVEVRVSNSNEASYQPAKDIDHLTIQEVLEAINNHGISDIPIESSEELDKIRESLRMFSDKNLKSDVNLLLKNL